MVSGKREGTGSGGQIGQACGVKFREDPLPGRAPSECALSRHRPGELARHRGRIVSANTHPSKRVLEGKFLALETPGLAPPDLTPAYLIL